MNQNMVKNEIVKADVLVLGGGIAGCLAAIKAREFGLQVVMVDKGNIGRSGMSHQMSGVLTYFDPDEDSHDEWYKECIEIGQGLVDKERLEGMIRETTDRIRDLESWGVKFQKENGKFIRKPGVGHLHARNVLMTQGGLQLMSVVRGEVLRCGVRTIERVMTTHLLTSDGELPTSGRVVGATGFNIRTGESYVFEARAVVIATGSTNSILPVMCMPILSGDGKAMAFRAGCQMRNVELASFVDYPVGFNCAPGSHILYGEDAFLTNASGERFMEKYDSLRLDRASRAVHTKAIAIEELRGLGPIFLDATHLDEAAYGRIEKCIPMVLRSFELGGVNLRRDKIPYSVGLTDHSTGGIRAKASGETTIPALYAAGGATDHGEDGVACVIGHGMESAIAGYRAGKAAASYAAGSEELSIHENQVQSLTSEVMAPLQRESGLTHQEVRKNCMSIWGKGLLGPIRNEEGLKEAVVAVREIREDQIPRLVAKNYHELARSVGLQNELLLLELLPRCALARTESRGSHYREDYPQRDDANWLKWVIAKKEGETTQVWTETILSKREGGKS